MRNPCAFPRLILVAVALFLFFAPAAEAGVLTYRKKTTT